MNNDKFKEELKIKSALILASLLFLLIHWIAFVNMWDELLINLYTYSYVLYHIWQENLKKRAIEKIRSVYVSFAQPPRNF